MCQPAAAVVCLSAATHSAASMTGGGDCAVPGSEAGCSSAAGPLRLTHSSPFQFSDSTVAWQQCAAPGRGLVLRGNTRPPGVPGTDCIAASSYAALREGTGLSIGQATTLPERTHCMYVSTLLCARVSLAMSRSKLHFLVQPLFAVATLFCPQSSRSLEHPFGIKFLERFKQNDKSRCTSPSFLSSCSQRRCPAGSPFPSPFPVLSVHFSYKSPFSFPFPSSSFLSPSLSVATPPPGVQDCRQGIRIGFPFVSLSFSLLFSLFPSFRSVPFSLARSAGLPSQN